MTMRPMAMLIPALFALAGCGSASDTGASNAATAAPTARPGGFASRIVGLSEGQRRGVILRAILDAGNQCPSVIGTRRQPQGVDGLPSWSATCKDGSNWLVSFSDDGMAHVTGLPARK